MLQLHGFFIEQVANLIYVFKQAYLMSIIISDGAVLMFML